MLGGDIAATILKDRENVEMVDFEQGWCHIYEKLGPPYEIYPFFYKWIVKKFKF